ncbi:histidine phosphatase family protein [Tomitella biformata]|uniref:histidine phosphatase family protein n=1 Tax=Tomitella biformata TaxID=630403 RepID=UPI000463FCC8|nr:histidine phosphatase family protein [Tomitella biformata]
MTVILLRHGRSTANTAATLAGRTPGVELDETGIAQALALVDRLGELPIAAIVTSPLQRCQQTVAPLAKTLNLEPVLEERLIEVDYGEWTGRPIAELLKEPMWKVVQQHPSAAIFPGGEGLASVQSRAVAAIREHDRELSAAAGQDCLWIACTHGDIIKSVLADALGTHLDGFQRIMTVPAAVSVIRYTEQRPFVFHMNDTGSDLSGLAAKHGAPQQEAKTGVPGGEV